MNISVFKDLYKSKDIPFPMELKDVLNRIKTGESKQLVEKIREGGKELKSKLPCILFAGEFTERNSNSLVKHSGLMVVDFDKYPDNEAMEQHLSILKENRHFITLFISPSGNGIKGVVKIPIATKETHPKYFKAFQKKFKYDYFDIANSNVDRVCFESYDPNIYINNDAELFEAELIDEGYTVSERVPLIPLTDEGRIIDKIMAFGWKRDFVEGERNAFIFDIAGAFCEYGISDYTAEGYIITNIIEGDFSESEARTTIKSAYRKRVFDSKFFEDYNKIEQIKSNLKNGKKSVIEQFRISDKVYDDIKVESTHEDFWDVDDKGKITVSPIKFKRFLEHNGYRKYFPFESLSSSFVFVNQNKVCETSAEKMKDFVLTYLLEKGEIDAWNYCAKFANMFSDQYLLILETIELSMLKDTKLESYIAYKNGILKVDKNKAELVPYFNSNDYVWEKHILNRDFVVHEDNSNDYKTFINNIADGVPLPIECVIGYLISTYKNRMNNKAVILNDEIISENPEGGTGKGVFVQGISQIRNVAILDGKSFDDKKSFPYQTVTVEHQILVFDDIVKNFNFESKFSLVTEGMTLERKNKDAIKMNVEESPKLILSTNYAVKGEGNSHDRRRHEVEVAQYYGKDLTPYDEFGKQLFVEWEEKEFERFDNYMVKCLQSFLKLGLIKQEAKNIKLRKFIAETSMEFYEWISDKDHLPLDIRIDKSVCFDRFISDYQDFRKWLSRKKFTMWIEKYCNYAELKYHSDKTNDVYWFVATKGKIVTDKDIDI